MFNEMHKLKTIEIDIENRIFKVNGENFGSGCDGFRIDVFRIECATGRDGEYRIYVVINNRTNFAGAFDLLGNPTNIPLESLLATKCDKKE